MDDRRRRFVMRLYEESRAHDQGLSDRLQRFRNVEPPTAELLGVMIRASGRSGSSSWGRRTGTRRSGLRMQRR